jgi:hypothetical protein
MRSKLDSLQGVLQERKADIVRYKEELSATLSRESELERKLVQAQLCTDQVCMVLMCPLRVAPSCHQLSSALR